MAKAIFWLTLFHLAFFRKFYFQNPYCYATSEALDTAFPSSHVLGQALRTGRLVEDDCYYPCYRSLPFLSSFYPPHCLQAMLGAFLPIDARWVLFSLTSVLHFLWSSIGAWLLFSDYPAPWIVFFGAVTFAYMGYSIKQNPSIIYTLAWAPWLLWAANTHRPVWFGLSMGMGILAGYWPVWIPMIPFGGLYWLIH